MAGSGPDGQKKRMRCAIYTRKSSEEGLEQEFNSLDAQREACEAYTKSQRSEGWSALSSRYDDGGFSGGNLERPALLQLLQDIKAHRVDVVVVYKIDRLTRSLMDFSKIVEVFDRHKVSFVSVTQQFNTTTSMGRLTLNILLSFAQFEREVTGERIRDKIAASKQKGMWMGGFVPIGYEAKDRTLAIKDSESETVRTIFRLYLELGNVRLVEAKAKELGIKSKPRFGGKGNVSFSRGYIYKLLSNPIYAGQIAHRGKSYPGLHEAIIDRKTWDAVQERLAENTQKHEVRSEAKEPSLLGGLIFDDTGDRLTPSHAVKKGKRYRYYISNRLITKSGTQDQGGGQRVPAAELEEVATAGIKSFLAEPAKLAEILELADISAEAIGPMIKRGTQVSAIIALPESPQCRAYLHRMISKITIGKQELEISINPSGFAALLNGDSESIDSPLSAPRGNAQTYELRLPLQLRHRGAETRLILLAPQFGPKPARDPALISLLARAYTWAQELMTDPKATVAHISKRDRVTMPYVSRIVPLGFLAPDILEAMLSGNQSPENTAKQLAMHLEIPLLWTAQRRLLNDTKKSPVSVT
ncbi:MAG: recombinase family protein [Pseudomonadota bacterium]